MIRVDLELSALAASAMAGHNTKAGVVGILSRARQEALRAEAEALAEELKAAYDRTPEDAYVALDSLGYLGREPRAPRFSDRYGKHPGG